MTIQSSTFQADSAMSKSTKSILFLFKVSSKPLKILPRLEQKSMIYWAKNLNFANTGNELPSFWTIYLEIMSPTANNNTFKSKNKIYFFNIDVFKTLLVHNKRVFKKCKNTFKIWKRTKRLWRKKLRRNNSILKDLIKGI
jgi:hypothetical protein